MGKPPQNLKTFLPKTQGLHIGFRKISGKSWFTNVGEPSPSMPPCLAWKGIVLYFTL